LITDYSEYTEVNIWYKFPWGANWCARKKALLEIGGFDIHYGRCGNDYGGGEELVAASLIQRLGYKIAISPQSEVIHVVEPKRFTSSYLWKTILAEITIRSRAQRDNFIHGESINWNNFGHAFTKKLHIFITDKREENRRIPIVFMKLFAHLIVLCTEKYKQRERKD
jgi:hypothetical protein